MESVSAPELVSRLVDCVAQLIIIAEKILQLISQGQGPCVNQNDGPEQAEAGAPAYEEDLLPDLGDLSDLESVFTSREDEDLILDIDQTMLEIDETYDDVLLSGINEDLGNG